MKAATSREAKANGLATYFTGRSCDAGHIAPRWAVSKTCVECQPMDRSPEYVRAMRAAFDAAYLRTLKTGYLHVPDLRDDGWWIVPARDEGSPVEDVPAIQEYRHG